MSTGGDNKAAHVSSGGGGGPTPSGPPAVFKICCLVDFVCDAADATFAHASDLVRKGDHITVLHVATEGKKASVAALAEHFQVKLMSRFAKARFDVATPAAPPGVPTRDAVVGALREQKCDLAVIGYSGRKGPKEDPSIMGSSADLSLREGRTSFLIVKAPVEGAGVGAGAAQRYLVAVDGGARSLAALQLAARLAVKGRDAVSAVCVAFGKRGVAGESEAAPIEAAARAAVGGALESFTVAPLGEGSVAAALAREAAARGATVLVVASTKEKGLGTTSSGCVKLAQCNVLVYTQRSGAGEEAERPAEAAAAAAAASAAAGEV